MRELLAMSFKGRSAIKTVGDIVKIPAELGRMLHLVY